jgi:hypothetical protein
MTVVVVLALALSQFTLEPPHLMPKYKPTIKEIVYNSVPFVAYHIIVT